MHRLASRLATLALVSVAAPALAQKSTPPSAIVQKPETGGDLIIAGVGVATIPSYEGSDSNRILPIAAARGSIAGYSFATRGAKLFVDLAKTDPGPVWDFQLGPAVGLNFNRTNGIDDARVEALGKKKVAFEAGGYIGIGKTGVITSDFDKLSVSVSYLNDVGGVHKSYVITPQIDYGTPLSRKAFVGLSATASYAGEGYANSYFGINAAGATRSGLPAFNADAGWKDVTVSALGIYSLTGDLLGGLSLVGGVSYSRLMNDFARSSVTRIAGDRDQFYAALGLALTF